MSVPPLSAHAFKRSPAFLILFFLLFLTACAGRYLDSTTWWDQNKNRVVQRVKQDFQKRNFSVGSPVYLRIFKKSAILQAWLRDEVSGDYVLYKTYPICKFSGNLGPKLYEGDLQSPEGFYTVEPGWMNPNSQYHLAFNIQYPNKYDRFYDRTGSFIMVHGGCKSVGCYAMTDKQIEEIYAIVDLAHQYGQRSVPIDIFPFHMTEQNLLEHINSPWYPFWRNLQTGYLLFEDTKRPPLVGVKNGAYVFGNIALN